MTHRTKTPWPWTWLLAALLCLLAATTAWELSRLASHARFYAQELLPAHESAHGLTLSLQDMRRTEYAYALANGSAERERLAQRMSDLGDATQRRLDALERGLAPGSPELRQLRAVRTALGAYLMQWERQRRPLGQSASAAAADARALLEGATARAFDDSLSALDAWWADEAQRARAQEQLVEVDAERAVLGMLGVVGLALLLASGAVAGASGSITRVDPERWASF